MTESIRKDQDSTPRPFTDPLETRPAVRAPAFRDRYVPSFKTSQARAGKMVFYGDQQIHHTVRRSSIQSHIYDKIFDVSIRPQAVVLAAPLFQREAMQLIRNEYADHHQYNMGDVLDTSNLREWGIYLNAEEESLNLQTVSVAQNPSDLLDSQEFYAALLDTYRQSDSFLPPIVEGNHDGAFAGNGLNHRVRPSKLKARIDALSFTVSAINRKLERLSHQRKTGEDTILRQESLKRARSRCVSEILELKTQLKNFEENRDELDLDPKLIPPKIATSLINSLLGAPKGAPMFSSRGAAAFNAGGTPHIVDKKKFISLYLSSRYKTISINPDTLEPLVTRLLYHSPETGYYRTEKSIMNNLNYGLPKNTLEHFQNFWKQVRPGEYLCLLELPGREDASANQRYIMLQAFDQGVDENGRHTYTFMLDGMDMTGENVPIAFFGALSGWQRKICQIFINTMRLKNGQDGNLFHHLSHFPLMDYSKGKWEKHGWFDYFKQADVVPYVFAAHRHHRAVLKENTPTNISLNLPILGTASIKKKKSASIVNPSLTDNMEFMTARTSYDPDTNRHSVRVDYHKIFSEDPDSEHYRAFAEDIVAEVERLRPTYLSHDYRNASLMKSDPFTTLHHILGTDHSAVIAFDTIPIMIRQFDETIQYTQSWFKFLLEDLGPDHEFVKKVHAVLGGLMRHREFWLHGNPDATDEFKKWGYLAVKQGGQGLPRRETIAALTEFNDLFDTPLYDMLRMLITDTPVTKENHKAYDFWLLLGKRAQDEENLPMTPGQRRKLKRFALPDTQTLNF